MRAVTGADGVLFRVKPEGSMCNDEAFYTAKLVAPLWWLARRTAN